MRLNIIFTTDVPENNIQDAIYKSFSEAADVFIERNFSKSPNIIALDVEEATHFSELFYLEQKEDD